MEVDFNPGYEIQKTAFGKRYLFFCDLTGVKVCTVEPIWEKNPHLALEVARKKARYYFNRCSQCGKWVCDNAFNMDVCQCVECAPFTRTPIYCTMCGAPLKTDSDCCVRCGHSVAGARETG